MIAWKAEKQINPNTPSVFYRIVVPLLSNCFYAYTYTPSTAPYNKSFFLIINLSCQKSLSHFFHTIFIISFKKTTSVKQTLFLFSFSFYFSLSSFFFFLDITNTHTHRKENNFLWIFPQHFSQHSQQESN